MNLCLKSDQASELLSVTAHECSLIFLVSFLLMKSHLFMSFCSCQSQVLKSSGICKRKFKSYFLLPFCLTYRSRQLFPASSRTVALLSASSLPSLKLACQGLFVHASQDVLQKSWKENSQQIDMRLPSCPSCHMRQYMRVNKISFLIWLA